MNNFFQNVYAWWNAMRWSDKGMVVLGIVFVIFLLWKFVFSKVPYKTATSMVYSPWKSFLKFLSLAAFVGMCIGIYFLVVKVTPPKSERLFKQIINNQIENTTKNETDYLGELAEKSGTSTLSGEELAKAERAREEAWKEREGLKNKLQKPSEKKEPSPPRVYVEWLLEVRATSALIESYGKQKPLIQRSMSGITPGKYRISLKYIAKSDEKEREIVLERDTPEQFYAGYYRNSDTRKNCVLWVKEPTAKEKEKEGGKFYDPVKKETVVRELILSGWMSKDEQGKTMDAKVSIVKQTTTAASKN